MAKIKYSALVSDMRNKLNGSVMSANRYGSYVRNKVTPVNPQTILQQQARQLFGALSSSWRSLTQVQRESWIEGAKNFPFTDIFGDTKHLSGQSLFIKLNSNLEKVGLARINAAPTPLGFDELDYALADGEDVTVNGAGEVSLPIEWEAQPGFTGVVYLTDPVPAGISFVKNRFRLYGTIGDISTVGQETVPLHGNYNEMFGAPQAGTRVFARIAFIRNASGEQSTPIELVSTQ